MASRHRGVHPDCPGVVNFDGHGWPSAYPGLTQSEVDSWKAKLKELFDAMAENMPPHHVALRPLADNGSVHDLYGGLTASSTQPDHQSG
jgi:hypothetical protein